MTTTLESSPAADHAPAPDHTMGFTPRLSAGGIIRSEWIKLRSVRSTVWCYGIIVLVSVAIGTLLSVFGDSHAHAVHGGAADQLVVATTTSGVNVAVLIVAVLGSLIITGEYGTGMIRATFSAVPSRVGAIAAKAVVLVGSTLITSLVAIWATALISWPILSSHNVDVNLTHSTVFLPLCGAAVYITLIALLAFAFGTILRSTAGSLATVLGLMMVAPLLLSLLGQFIHADLVTTLTNLLPQNAGSALMSYSTPQAGWHDGVLTLNRWGGLISLAVWNLVTLTVATILVKRRDA